MRYCCLFTGQQVPPSTFRTYNKQQSALIGMQTVMIIIPVRSQNWRFCCPGNPKIHNQYFLYVTESRDCPGNPKIHNQYFLYVTESRDSSDKYTKISAPFECGL